MKNKKIICIILFFILFFSITQFTSNSEKTALSLSKIPSDFIYDGCSMFPDGDYGDCCKTHDDGYFFGGSWQERLAVDNSFYACIKDKGNWYHQVLAPTMWLGVRVGGAPIFPTSFRWGFGRDIY